MKQRDAQRTVLWCEAAEFLVVLEVRRKSWVLLTAYPVTEEHRKRKLQREYERYTKNKR